jgi:hypothetical protein
MAKNSGKLSMSNGVTIYTLKFNNPYLKNHRPKNYETYVKNSRDELGISI